MTNFDKAFRYTLQNEGGFSNHKADSGGATNFGITIHTWKKWVGKDVTPADVKNITEEEAKAVYRAWYWEALKLDQVRNPEIAIAIFDASVLFGVHQAGAMTQRVLQRADKTIAVDGKLGPQSLEALNRMSHESFIIGFQIELMSRVDWIIRTYPKNAVFARGWMNRITRFTTLIA